MMNGTASSYITIKPDTGEPYWQVISIINNSGSCQFSYVKITKSTTGDNTDRDRAAISASNCREIQLDHVEITDCEACVYYNTTEEKCYFYYCKFEANTRGSIMALVKSDVVIDHCEYVGNDGFNSDAIDFDKVVALITNNLIYGMTGGESDAIDMGSASECTVMNNVIHNIKDSGIEAEESSVISASRNVVYDCGIGATIKELAEGTLINNTFYNVDTCFTAYSEQGLNTHGGKITAKNNIMSQVNRVYNSRNNSTVTLTYNLRDEGTNPGTGNIVGDPKFVSEGSHDFHIQQGSAAIDAGDPDSPKDEDGTRADMGAFAYFQQAAVSLMITEINYRPLTNGYENPDREYIEIYNAGQSTVNLAGYHFTSGIDYTFPAGATLEPGTYLLVVRDASYYSSDLKYYQWTTGNLSNSGELIELKTNTNTSAAIITYSYLTPWPRLPSKYDLTIQLKATNLDYKIASSWRTSYVGGGTPGKPNTQPSYNKLFINELVSHYGNTYPDEHGLYSDWIEIYNGYEQDVDLGGLYLTDDYQVLNRAKILEGYPDSTCIASKGFYVFRADLLTNLGANHLDFQLASSGEQVALSQTNGASYRIIDSLKFGSLGIDVSYGRYPDGGSAKQSFQTATPGNPNQQDIGPLRNILFINEFVAKFGTKYPDEHGLFSDWIEIYNNSNNSVNLGGLYLSDKKTNLTLSKIPSTYPDSVTITPYGFYVFRADAMPNLGVNHADFELASAGEQVVLSQKIGNQVVIIDSITYGPQTTDISYGRMRDGSSAWMFFTTPTPGKTNSGSGIGDIENANSGNLTVYPNPVSDHFYASFEVQNPGKIRFLLMNMQGQCCAEMDTELTSAPQNCLIQWDLRKSGKSLPSGIYNLIIRTNSGVLSHKIVILEHY
jgi:parallel beta-helix repeat protein